MHLEIYDSFSIPCGKMFNLSKNLALLFFSRSLDHSWMKVRSEALWMR